jgi:DNA-binding transcriptional regulator YiaG
MSDGTVFGKELKSVRATLKMTQQEFARWLSSETGEIISSMQVCRMESFGRSDACSPQTPSQKVIQAISTYLPKKV